MPSIHPDEALQEMAYSELVAHAREWGVGDLELDHIDKRYHGGDVKAVVIDAIRRKYDMFERWTKAVAQLKDIDPKERASRMAAADTEIEAICHECQFGTLNRFEKLEVSWWETVRPYVRCYAFPNIPVDDHVHLRLYVTERIAADARNRIFFQLPYLPF